MSTGIRKIKRKDGGYSWRLTVEAGTHPDGRRRQVVRTFKTEREALAAQAKVRVTVNDGTFVAKHKVTVREYVDEWLTRLTKPRPNTRAGYESAFKPLLALIGDKPIQRLTSADVAAARDTMLTTGGRKGPDGKPKGRSPRTVNLCLGRFAAVMESARLDNLVAVNVAESKRVGPAVSHDVAAKPVSGTWSEEQVQVYPSHVINDRYIAAWRLSFLGLRRSEVLGLRWECVDLDAGTITVQLGRTARKSAKVGDEPTIKGSPKSQRSHRTLPIPAVVVSDLRALRRVQQQERLALGKPLTGSDFVVSDWTGFAISPDWYSTMFQRNAKAAGLPRIRLHDARHSAATFLHLQGIPVAAAARYLGHDPVMYLRVYTHGEDALGDASAALDRLQATGTSDRS